MTRRDDEAELVLDERDGEEIVIPGDTDRERNDAEIELAAEHRGGDGARSVLSDVKAEARVLATDGGDNGGKKITGGGRAAADSDRPGLEAHELADGLNASIGAPDRILRVRQEDAPGLGEFDAAPGAVKERRPHFRLQLAEHG